jgi:hypothetical protein
MELYENVNAKLTADDKKNFKISLLSVSTPIIIIISTIIIYKLVIYFLIHLCVRIFLS